MARGRRPRPPPAPPRMPVRPGPHFEHCRGSSGRKRARSLDCRTEYRQHFFSNFHNSLLPPLLSKQSNAEKLTRFFKKILNFLKFFQIQLFSSQLSTDNAFHNLQILQQTCDCYNFLLHIPLL